MTASLTISTGARLPSGVGGRPAPMSAAPNGPAGAGLSLSVRRVCCVGVFASCRANQCRDASARQQRLKNDCSPKTDLEQLFGRSGQISRRSISRSGSAAANAGRNTSSTASGAASCLRVPFTSSKAKCSTEFTVRRRVFKALFRSGESDPIVRAGCRGAETLISSGGGLGIHEPGSNTRGFASRRQSPSGRARNRAMCPAVARSFVGRAA